MARTDIDSTIKHVARAVDNAQQSTDPFLHLRLSNILPDNLYAEALSNMPLNEDYRLMSGRAKSTRMANGDGARIKLDLFPEFTRHLPEPKKDVWTTIGKALCSSPVGEAFKRKLATGLGRRFGPGYSGVGMYPIPNLTRDRPGYTIGIHPDTHWKGITAQLYFPRDNSAQHVGTVFHKRTGENAYERVCQIPFLPNTGYAFAVDTDTYHSVDPVGPEVQTRDSILLTYFVDNGLLKVFRNRGRRVGNLLLNEFRHLRRGW